MKPLILSYAVLRKDEASAPYKYDFAQSLNTIVINDEKKIFIDTGLPGLSIATGTKVSREVSDNGISLIELKTLTEVKRERDEQSNAILELQTKTLTRQESDDQGFINFQ